MRRLFSAILASVVTLLTATFGIGGSAESEITDAVETLSATATTYEVNTYSDVQYGTGSRNYVDICMPKGKTGTIGLILYIHGGGWSSGDKSIYSSQIEKWAAKGYVSASMNYTYVSKDDGTNLYNIGVDINAALAKIKSYCSKKGVTIKKCILAGHSAGGHLSMLYAYSLYSIAPIKPVAVVSYAGPVCLYAKDFIVNPTLGDTSGFLTVCCGADFTAKRISNYALTSLKNLSPITYVTKNTVPTILAYGLKDTVVLYNQAQMLDEKLTKKGVTHTLVTYPNSDHGLSNDPDCSTKTRTLFEQYAATYLK